jgi:hypothetical protein
MTGKCERVGSLQRILRTIDVGSSKPNDVFGAPKAKLSDQCQSGNVCQLIEIVAIDRSQLGRDLPGRTPKASVDFEVRLR